MERLQNSIYRHSHLEIFVVDKTTAEEMENITDSLIPKPPQDGGLLILSRGDEQ